MVRNRLLGDSLLWLLPAVSLLPLIPIISNFLNCDLTSWDMAGHYLAAKEYGAHIWPWFSGWNAYSFGGFPQGVFYPSLFEWLCGGLGKLFGIDTVFKALVVLSLVLLPYSLFLFMRILSFTRWQASIATFWILSALLLFTHALSFGASFEATFCGGLVTAQWALPWCFFYLWALLDSAKNQKPITKANLFLSVVILSHGFLAIEVVMVSICQSLILSKTLGWSWIRRYVLHGLMTSLLCVVWIGPFLYFHRFSTPTASSAWGILKFSRDHIYFFACSLAFVIVMAFTYRRKLFEESALILYPFLLLVFLYLCLRVVPRELLLAGEVSVHPYRLLPFAVILFGIIFGFFLGRFWRAPWASVAAYAVLIASSISFMRSYALPIYRHVTGLPSLSSRGLVNEDRRSLLAAVGSPYLIEQRLEDSKVPLLNGVFQESSDVSPFIYSYLLELDPQAFISYARPFQAHGQLARWHGSLLGVNWIVSNARLSDFLNANEQTIPLRIEVGAHSTDVPQWYYSSPTFLAEFMPAAPLTVARASQWTQMVSDWWNGVSDASRMPVLEARAGSRAGADDNSYVRPLATDKVTLTDDQNHGYLLDIDSTNEQWVYLKIPYFPDWTAQQNGAIPIYEAGPHMMAVYAKGRVHLSFERSSLEKTCAWISLIAWLASAFNLLLRKPEYDHSLQTAKGLFR